MVTGGGGRRALRRLVDWFRLIVEGIEGGCWREEQDMGVAV